MIIYTCTFKEEILKFEDLSFFIFCITRGLLYPLICSDTRKRLKLGFKIITFLHYVYNFNIFWHSFSRIYFYKIVIKDFLNIILQFYNNIIRVSIN